MQNHAFSATLNDPALTFQYHTATVNPTLDDAIQRAKEELERRRPGEETEDICLLGVRASGAQSMKLMKGQDRLQKGDNLQLQRDTVPLIDYDARRKAKARLAYEPTVSNVAYVFMARVVSGKASTGATQNRPANKFLHDKPENAEMLKRLLKAGNRENYDPQQFVDAADDNYAFRQGYAHNKSDAWLKQTAADLRTVGAQDLLRETHPFQCMIIERMDAMLSAL